MSVKLLREYLRLVISESPLARVPTQLLDPGDQPKKKDGCECGARDDEACQCAELEEFSGVGGIAGYTGPLGADPDGLGRKKNAPKKK